MSKKPKSPIAKYNESLSEDQHCAKKIIDNSVISCLIGYAGTGKTRLATTYALEQYALGRKNGGINKIVITRPAVARKKDYIGFLPGDISEKYGPWVKPIDDILKDIEGGENVERLKKDGIVEVMPLMYIQGVTFTNSIVIIDEAQNLTKEDVKSIFTRLGKSSKMIFCGDYNQCIIPKEESGLPRLLEMSDIIKDLNIYELHTNWRNKLVEELLNKY